MQLSKSSRNQDLRPEHRSKRFSTQLGVLVAAGVVVVAALCATVIVVVADADTWPCDTCHAFVMETQPDAAHADVRCYSCHAPSPVDGVLEFWEAAPAMLLPALADEGARWSAGDERACEHCHELLELPVDGSGSVRFDHVACASAEIGCSWCHGFDHGTSAMHGMPMEDCVACHLEASVSIECDSCHAERERSERLENGPWQVTHGPQWETTHGSGTLPWCSTCHPDDYCVRCHGIELPHPANFGRTHGELAIEARDSCIACHDERTLCDSCHGIEMPHSEDFLAEHSGIAESRDDGQCLECHRSEDCIACHVRHTHPGSTDGSLSDRLGAGL